jgi:hypothetical protein
VARTGDPCSCPDLLRGAVPGHIERLSVGAVRQRRAPPDDPESDDDRWGRLTGP